MAPRPEHVFRLAGVLAALWIVVPETLGIALAGPSRLLADAPPGTGPGPARVLFAAILLFQAGTAAAFAALFWRLTRQAPPGGAGRGRLAGLGLQTAIGLLGNAGHLILLASELPLALPGRLAVRWLAAQVALLLLLVVALVSSGLLPAQGPGEVAVVLVPFVGWQLVAFALGSLAARERQQRLEVGRVNAELVATRLLLAEASRLAERSRLARELHDGLGHGLAAIGVSLDLAERTARGAVRETVVAVRNEARDLYREVRSVVSALRAAEAGA